ARGGELVRDQLIGQVTRLELVPQLVLLSAGDAEDTQGALGLERLDEGGGAGQVAADGAVGGGVGLGGRGDVGEGGEAGERGSLEGIAAVDLGHDNVPLRGWRGTTVSVVSAGAGWGVDADVRRGAVFRRFHGMPGGNVLPAPLRSFVQDEHD